MAQSEHGYGQYDVGAHAGHDGCAVSDYCAYSHFSAMLDRSQEDWWIAVIDLQPDDFEVYFDDSGTDDDSPVAVAACYIASKKQWDEFTRSWREVAQQDGFGYFHMTDFMLNPVSVDWDRVKPRSPLLWYRDWDSDTRRRVYTHLAGIICARTRHAFGVTISKQDYDELIPHEMRRHMGTDHYAWAIKILIGSIGIWRKKWGGKRPMQYVFSNVPKGKGTKRDILGILESARLDDPDSEEKYGIVQDGFGFQDMKAFPPLQAADILAWNLLDHYNNVVVPDKDDLLYTSRWFRPLRLDRPNSLGFITREQMEEFSGRVEHYKATTGHYPSRQVERLLRKEGRLTTKRTK